MRPADCAVTVACNALVIVINYSQRMHCRRYADPATALLRLYCMDLDEDVLWSVMTGLGVHDKASSNLFRCAGY